MEKKNTKKKPTEGAVRGFLLNGLKIDFTGKINNQSRDDMERLYEGNLKTHFDTEDLSKLTVSKKYSR